MNPATAKTNGGQNGGRMIDVSRAVVPLTAALTLLAVSAGGVWKLGQIESALTLQTKTLESAMALQNQGTNTEIKDLRTELEELKASFADYPSNDKLRSWIELLRAQNPELQVPMFQ